MSRRRVVITGYGCVTPLGNSAEATWTAAKEGRSGIAPVTRFNTEAFTTTIAGEVKNFDPLQYFDTKELRRVDYFTQYAVAAAEEAMQHSGLKSVQFDSTRAGSILGVGIGGLTVLEKFHALYLERGPRKISPFLIPGMISNLAPGTIGIRFGLKGVNFTIQSACTSSTHAIGECTRMIGAGLQDVMVAGGAEASITPTAMGGFCAMKAMSTRNDEPTLASRPFDRDRDGFVMGEGGIILTLESLEHAQARGATIHAEIVGYGTSCDAYHITAPSIDGEGAERCMRMAIEDAGVEPSAVGYVNAHGTSTPANDVSESAALRRVFGSWAREGLAVSSTKSMTGHLLGAAGAIEAFFCVRTLQEGVIAPTLNLDNPDEGCDLDYTPHTARSRKVEYAMSNSFGFGGTNASILIKAA